MPLISLQVSAGHSTERFEAARCCLETPQSISLPSHSVKVIPPAEAFQTNRRCPLSQDSLHKSGSRNETVKSKAFAFKANEQACNCSNPIHRKNTSNHFEVNSKLIRTFGIRYRRGLSATNSMHSSRTNFGRNTRGIVCALKSIHASSLSQCGIHCL